MRSTSIEELRMIAAVEAHGSLTAAAEALGVSQQAVS
ncbi:MAG: LysR family transcriptional regulator, partial [Demequinaceae bacterium]|nr:LysR family transcriptional regulator [Demequinaceae bacterium]